jgi:hypothetical protein
MNLTGLLNKLKKTEIKKKNFNGTGVWTYGSVLARKMFCHLHLPCPQPEPCPQPKEKILVS